MRPNAVCRSPAGLTAIEAAAIPETYFTVWMSLPSGDQEGVSSSPGLVVTWVDWAPIVGVVGGDDPDVSVVGAVGVRLRAIAGEGDEMAVGGTGGVGIIVIAAGDLGQVFWWRESRM